MRRTALALLLAHGVASATDCPGLAGRFEILWPGERAQPMRVAETRQDGQLAYRVEVALPDGQWVVQRAGTLANRDRSELGLLPRCALMVEGYGLFAVRRAFDWTGLPGTAGAGWAFWAEERLWPVERLGD
ncbi:hypothetical protein [Crenobacter caeni]|uniref:Uncharacterized protein n=1 Tax=Crenobacter caeni TaxID=2705474 RepID=A0A6B2KUL2_9NEIS|nr:hypothetical protein [Crenobacter caeni]NDV13703.1 hypothetical protein [Crenobacter caeni]